jgi:hypothetical protein
MPEGVPSQAGNAKFLSLRLEDLTLDDPAVIASARDGRSKDESSRLFALPFAEDVSECRI